VRPRRAELLPGEGRRRPPRLLFAIDYPYEGNSVATKFLVKADLDDEQRAAISHRNAERIFRLPPKDEAASG
jgi:predicted TIM-barrel fold metal-dependent hydrolase